MPSHEALAIISTPLDQDGSRNGDDGLAPTIFRGTPAMRNDVFGKSSVLRSNEGRSTPRCLTRRRTIADPPGAARAPIGTGLMVGLASLGPLLLFNVQPPDVVDRRAAGMASRHHPQVIVVDKRRSRMARRPGRIGQLGPIHAVGRVPDVVAVESGRVGVSAGHDPHLVVEHGHAVILPRRPRGDGVLAPGRRRRPSSRLRCRTAASDGRACRRCRRPGATSAR